MLKFDRRRKYYMILDCETATLPCAANYGVETGKKIAIAKPLIYDLGWQIIDRNGNVYEKKNFLITEIFSVPSVFNTAYYAEKRPLYIEKLRNGEIVLTDWNTAISELLESMAVCYAVGAYNSMFDFKKAIPFTETYIDKLYSDDFHAWMSKQEITCKKIAFGSKQSSRKFEPDFFIFRDKKYLMFDVWGMACEHLLNCDEYKRMCIENHWQSASGKYFATSAEKAYRFLKQNTEFDEAHTALDDAIIESEIFSAIMKPKISNFIVGITYFPFRILGKVENYVYQYKGMHEYASHTSQTCNV